MKQNFTIVCLLCALLLCRQVNAQILFNETFSYTVGSNLEGSNGGTGFTTAWSNSGTGNTGANTLAQIVAGKIDPSASSNSTGDKLQVTLPTGVATTVRYDRAVPAFVNNDVSTQGYWLGFWLRIPAANISTSTYGVAAQIILMNGANSTVLTDMRLGFGKTSNYASGANSANALSMFTRAAPSGCGALNFPSAWNTATAAQQGFIGLSTVTDNVIYVLANIKKLEFPNYQLPSAIVPNPNPIANFDGFRYWILSAPPTGISDPIFTAYPNGHVSQIEPVTNNPLPLQNRVLRADNTVNTTCVKDGATGLRIRVEGNPGATSFLVEFDEIRLGNSLDAIIIPITLSDFQAYQKGNTNAVKWVTESEYNNKGFYIERSKNGTNWSSLGFVTGATNSLQRREYNFTDETPFSVTFYRIKQVDLDGTASYSKTVRVSRKGNEVLMTLSPNPAQNKLLIQLNRYVSNSTVTVFNATGSMVLRTNITTNNTPVDVSTLSKGIYYVRVNTGEETLFDKFVKN